MSLVPTPSDPKRESILAGAQVQFSRYGFRRTSMEDIAKETGVSRASLYSYFENKEEIFRDLSIVLHEEALGNAERILKDETGRKSLEERGGCGRRPIPPCPPWRDRPTTRRPVPISRASISFLYPPAL